MKFLGLVALVLALNAALITAFVTGSRISGQNVALQNPKPLIVGGENADINYFRFQLSLRFRGSHICGASAISDSWAITAAHCVIGWPNVALSDWTLFGGTEQRSNNLLGVELSVLEIFAHPNYVVLLGYIYDYDIACYRTEGLLSSGLIEPIPLADVGSNLVVGTIVTVSGWGLLDYNDNFLPELLQYVNVPVVDWDLCNSQHFNNLTSNHLCASAPGLDACNGDSGGPLIWGGVQYGMVAFGIDCAVPTWAGAYTLISAPAIRNYIQEITGI